MGPLGKGIDPISSFLLKLCSFCFLLSPVPSTAPSLPNHFCPYKRALKNFPLSRFLLQSPSYYSASIQDQAHQLSLVLLHPFILHFIWLQSYCPLEMALVKGTRDFHGANLMTISLFLPMWPLAPNTAETPSFWNTYLSWFPISRYFPCLSGYSPSVSLFDSPSSTNSKLWTLSGLGLSWILVFFFFLPLSPVFPGQGALTILGGKFFVVWYVLGIEGLLMALVSRHLNPI